MNNPSPIKIAKMELQGLTMLYNTMVQECWSKCIPNTKEAELNVGEQSCTDRCISKYLEASNSIQEKFQQIQMRQMQQAQQQQQQQSSSSGGWFS